MISKELLNKVLNIEIVSYQMKQKNILAYEYNKVSKNQWSGKTFCNRSINIYELAHKCKEWASTHNYSVKSGWEMTHWGGAYRVEVFRNSNNILFSMSTVDTEPEAIFKACQWILTKDSK